MPVSLFIVQIKMFYPSESLKKGGRFYLCWVADSWPLRFATITHRQLWSQDIRQICDDLIEVMNNESGRPNCRFSLRLSSQLMRGLVRLYQKKVSIFLSDLCMINAHVIKNYNKRLNINEVLIEPVERRPRPRLQIVDQELPDEEPRVEELIQNSGNVVNNIQDITLKEATIPDFQLPPNDGFGEEQIDQALLGDRTVEMMLVAPETTAQYSGLDIPMVTESLLDITAKSLDKSRFLVDSNQDVSMFKATGEVNLPAFDKDIPEIPDIPIPDIPVPQPDKQPVEDILVVTEPPEEVVPEKPKEKEPEVIELEELEAMEPPVKRRRKNKLIVDKNTKLSSEFLRARTANIHVDLRCEESIDDIVDLNVPALVYLTRPAHSGHRHNSNLSYSLTHLFVRNLGVYNTIPFAEREIEGMLADKRSRLPSRLPRPTLQNIIEEEEPAAIIQPQIDQPVEPMDFSKDLNISAIPRLSEVPRVSDMQDISELLTQKVETLSQAQKRAADTERSPKRRAVGYVSFRESQQMAVDIAATEILEIDANKENVPENLQSISQPKGRRDISTLLEEAGIAEIPLNDRNRPLEIEIVTDPASQRRSKNGSETPLGSLDRTKVSLGDSEQTTDSKRFIREEWGVEGTMHKLLRYIKKEEGPLTVEYLIKKGPILPGYRKMSAARCFSSLLKLRQHRFINIIKVPGSTDIKDIILGSKFDQVV